MRRALIMATMLLAGATFAAAREDAAAQPSPAPTPKPATSSKAANDGKKPVDSPMVHAAKSATANKNKAKVSLNNADVKKSSGKLIIISAQPITAKTNSKKGDKKGTVAAAATTKKASTIEIEASRYRLVKAEREVETLDKDLRRVEQEYYNEVDPNYRTDVIAPRFEQTKRQLEKARQELADARDALLKPAEPSPK